MNAVIVVQEEMLEQVLMRVLVKAGILKAAEQKEEAATEVNTRKAKKLLAEKGYQVTGTPAFNRLIKEHGIKGKRRGKENWYKVDVLSRIPARV